MRHLLLLFAAIMLAMAGLIAPTSAREQDVAQSDLPPLYRAEMTQAQAFVTEMME